MDNHRTDNINDCLVPVKVKELKKYQWFTRKPIMYPTDKQVFIRQGYYRDINKYECMRFSDINDCIYLKGDTIVYTNFTF